MLRALAPVALLLAAAAAAQPLPAPLTIAYQGVLADADGTPVPDGSVAVEVALFDVPAGGTAAYVEAHTVEIEGGAFALRIGGGTPSAGTWAAVAFDRAWWLEVAVEGSPLGPRTPLGPAPYARGLAGPVEASTATPTPALTARTSADGGAALLGAATASTGTPAGVRGEAASDWGRGVYGEAPQFGVYGVGTRAAGFSYGVWGESASTTGRGVIGKATAATGVTYGVVGQADSDTGRGVFGLAPAPGGTASGVWGEAVSAQAQGVTGRSLAPTGAGVGVAGYSQSTGGQGVYGVSTAATGVTAGVVGEAASSDGEGVRGEAPMAGVRGVATATSGAPVGVVGSSGHVGVQGLSTGAYGVVGISSSPSGRGVSGVANAPSGSPAGVAGTASAPNGYGVYGRHDGSGYAGYFTGGSGVYVAGDVRASRVRYPTPRTHHASLAPGAFRPARSNGGTDYFVTSSFSYLFESTTQDLVAGLTLPDGATVDELSCYVRDNASSQGLRCRLMRVGRGVSGPTAQTLAQTAATVGTPGWVFVSASAGGHTVDNFANAYYVVVGTDGGFWETFDLALGQVVVRYRLSEAP